MLLAGSQFSCGHPAIEPWRDSSKVRLCMFAVNSGGPKAHKQTYPGFGPVGPQLPSLEPTEYRIFDRLRCPNSPVSTHGTVHDSITGIASPPPSDFSVNAANEMSVRRLDQRGQSLQQFDRIQNKMLTSRTSLARGATTRNNLAILP